jgi:tetratricopeptide (TPR) repeat protein
VNRQAIEKANEKLAASPGDRTALYLRGLAYQNLASWESALKRSWWASFRAGAKTFRDHRDLLRRDPQFHDGKLSIGVYEYVTGSLPWKVKWLALLLGYNGSRTRGKGLIREAAEKAALAGDDSRVILILIHTRERDYATATKYLSELKQKYPNNYLIPLDIGGLALLMKQPARAIAEYQEILRAVESGGRFQGLEKALVYNRLGVALREKGDLSEGAAWLARALNERNTSPHTITVSRLELGKLEDMRGRREEALKRYREVLAAEDFAGSHAEAQQLLRQPHRR